MRKSILLSVLVVVLVSSLSACGGSDNGQVTIYTSVTQATVDAVVDAFRTNHPDVTVEVFRAPTGELTARIASEQRTGGIQADVLWLTDPLSMQQYAAEGLLRSWEPAGAEEVADGFKTDTFWGTRLLNMVLIARDGTTAPVGWSDLTSETYRDRVVMPDPGFAGSALAVLGYFATDPRFGMDFYRDLSANGARQVNSPGDVVTEVAEGRADVGITLAFSAKAAIAKGSPIALVWPEPGAIAIYSPIAVVDSAGGSAEDFVEFVLSPQGQELIASTGWQPIRADVAWPPQGASVGVNWASLFDRRDELLDEYRQIFGG